MPSENNVQFKQGLKQNYIDIPTKDPYTLYFCTDTGELYLGDTLYSSSLGLVPGFDGDVASNPDDIELQEQFNTWIESLKNVKDKAVSASDTYQITYVIVNVIQDFAEQVSQEMEEKVLE